MKISLTLLLTLAVCGGSEVTSREETTERSAKQVYQYQPNGGTIYPSSIYPSVYPGSYNPTYPTYNPTYPTYTGVGFRGSRPWGGSGEGFTVRRASPSTRQGSRIIFVEPVTQGGSGWNRATSEYTAPATGLYFFTFAAVSDRNSYFRISLRHNGIEMVSAFGDAAGYQMGSQSCVLRLNARDQAYLQLDEGRLYDLASSRAYTTFSGFRIY